MNIRLAAALTGVACAVSTSLGATNDQLSFRDIFDAARDGVRFESFVAQGPYDTLKFDINQFNYSALGPNSAAAVLSDTFDGAIEFSFNPGLTRLNSVEGRDGGRFGAFTNAGNGGILTTFTGILEFTGGFITSGSFQWSNDQNDDVATGTAGAGGFITTVGSGFQVNGLVLDFVFSTSDRTFGEVDLSDFYQGVDLQNPLSNLVTGDFQLLRLSGASSGTADGEWVVTVPAPGVLSALGLGCIIRRRRR